MRMILGNVAAATGGRLGVRARRQTHGRMVLAELGSQDPLALARDRIGMAIFDPPHHNGGLPDRTLGGSSCLHDASAGDDGRGSQRGNRPSAGMEGQNDTIADLDQARRAFED